MNVSCLVRHLRSVRLQRIALSLFCIVPLPENGTDEIAPPESICDEIVEHMTEADERRAAELRNYVCIRHYVLNNRRFGVHAAMKVRMKYSFPGYKQFDVLKVSGPSAIRQKVFERMLKTERDASRDEVRSPMRITRQNYSFSYVSQGVLDGRQCFVLNARPKAKNPLLFEGHIWIDAQDFAIVRIEGKPAQNPSFWIRKASFVHRYKKIGPFWLAASNESGSDVRIFGFTELRIEYAEYEINLTGLYSGEQLQEHGDGQNPAGKND